MIGQSSLWTAVIAGVLAGLGVALVVRSTASRSLGRLLSRLPWSTGPTAGGPTVPPLAHTYWQGCLRRASRPRADMLAHDRELMECSAEAHAAHRIMGVLTGVLGSLVALLVLAALGVRLPVPIGTTVLGGSVIAGFLLTDQRLRRRAASRRADVVAALSAYVDLVTVLLAGGAGLETALTAAARAGDGYTFAQIRRVLAHARSHRESVWTGFVNLGRSIGVGEFVELGASLQLAGQQGARIANTLSTRAATLRARVLSSVEADAQSASERMGLPTVLMFVGFLVLLGYPAAQIILGSA